MQVHSLTNFCIVMYVDMACIVRTDDISITRSKRVNEKSILRYTVQDNDQFPCKSSISSLTLLLLVTQYGSTVGMALVC